MKGAIHHRLFATFLMLSVVAAGCAASGTSASPEGSSTSISPTISPPTSTNSGVADSSTTEVDATDSTIREFLDIPGIELLTQESGGGTRPKLSWEPVDQAFFYNVVLLDPEGRGYWGWEGTATAVHVGGEPVIKEGLSGPSVIEGMNWQVAAYDSDLNLIALSHKQSIAP